MQFPSEVNEYTGIGVGVPVVQNALVVIAVDRNLRRLVFGQMFGAFDIAVCQNDTGREITFRERSSSMP